MTIANNPIPGGWRSDPSVLRVGQTYYMATSTFEWMPGINLFESNDLVHWTQLLSALDDTKIDLEGIESACGVWAPNLTWKDGTFYLVYTIVQTARYRFKDTHNYVVTAKNMHGPWSNPVYLHSIGFDPSIFHDDDGQSYLVSQTMEHRTNLNRFQGVTIQPLNLSTLTLQDKPHIIFSGTSRGTTEGPNMMKKDGWYYLTVAEGGTEFGHCVTLARSKNLFGPYEVDPCNPLLSSTGTSCPLQRAGHGQFFSDPQGNWYLAHLCSRPFEGKWSILGRECAIQNIDWPCGEWPHLTGNIQNFAPALTYTVPTISENLLTHESETISFDKGLPIDWMTLRRCTAHCGISFNGNTGVMHITGGNSLCSNFRQHLAARRITSIHFSASVQMHFSPRCANHMAGLVCIYNNDNWHYLAMSRDEIGYTLTLTTCENGELTDYCVERLPNECSAITLFVSANEGYLHFGFDTGAKKYVMQYSADLRILSDEHVRGNGFTSAMIGLCCQDLQGDEVSADFDNFSYHE